MRAVVYDGAGGRDVVAVRDVAEPACGADDALVEVAFAGLNRADILEREGRYPAPRDASGIPGMEFSGTVRTTGANVTNVAPGDRVCGLVAAGAQAELVSCPALLLAKLPDDFSLERAAAIPEAFVTAHDALFARGAFRLGETALVHAVGSGVGLAAVALVKCAGGTAVGTSRSAEKLSRAEALGLDAGIALEDGWPGRVLAATNARGADVILDFVGAPLLERNVAALAHGGRIVQIGTLGGAQATFNLGVFMAKRAALHGTVLRTRPLYEKIALVRNLERALLPLFARGALRAEVDRVYALDDVRQAHERMESDANFGKILLATSSASPT